MDNRYPPLAEFDMASPLDGQYDSANFADSHDSRPSGVHMESLGGNQDAINGITQQILQRQYSEVIPPPASPALTSNNWRRRLREVIVKQNETLFAFLLKPIEEHPIIGPAEKALSRYAIRQDVDFRSVRTVKELLEDISGVSYESEINNRLDSTNKSPSSLANLRTQVNVLIDLYKETGDRLAEAEGRLKQQLDKMDKIQRSIGAMMNLQSNDAMPELVASMEKYLQQAFRDLQIETAYKKVLEYYKKHMMMREAIQFIKTDSIGSEPLCAICIEEPVGVTLTPCGHTFCVTCSRRMATDCPICRCRMKEKVKLYFS
jgi:hypothetical protein